MTLGVIATALVIAIIVATITVTKVRDTQIGAVDTINNTKQTLHLIRDCTEPSGSCYQRSQKQTADAVDNIGLLSTYAAACADQPDQQTAVEIRECVLDLLDRPRPKR